jgi:opacity protein-like surface antigen
MATAAFAQDDWRITPKFTLNLGLRYEYKSPIREINNLFGNFDPNLGMVQQGQPSVGSSIYKPDYKDFSPRLGFAWDVMGNGTTVVRGGASVIYSTMVAATLLSQGAQNTSSVAASAVPTGACTSAVTPCPQTFGGNIQFASIGLTGSHLNWNSLVFPTSAGVSCTMANQCDLQAVDPHLKTPSVVNFNLGVQHAFSNNLALEVGYVGNHGENLLGLRNINECAPSNTLDGGICVRPYGASVKFPYLRDINQISNYARSNYDSLQATLTERVTHGVSFIAGYTYAHGLDTVSLNRNGLIPQNSLDPTAEYANSDFDIRHRFTFTASYDIPGRKGFGQLLEGWKLNGILTLSSGIPWIVNDFGNNFSGSYDLSDRWDFFGNPGDFTSGSSTIPYCSGFAISGGINDVQNYNMGGTANTNRVSCSQRSGVRGAMSIPANSEAMIANCVKNAPDLNTLVLGGCYANGNSVMVPPQAGTFGTMGRNLFRDAGFRNVDFSVFKNFTFTERISAQFRVELFNLFNHPNVANPYGSGNTFFGGIDPSNPAAFGCGCTTPDVAAGNPIIGSGSARAMQLGLKISY